MGYKNIDDALRYGKEYRSMCKKLKICVSCKNQDAYTLAGRTYCSDCAEKYAKLKHDKFYTNKESIEQRKKQRKELRERHIKNHECSVCGNKLPENYKYHTCSKCRTYNKLRQNSSFTRGENGICWTCNKEKALKGKRLCQKCYDRQLKILSAIPINLNHKWRKFKYGQSN